MVADVHQHLLAIGGLMTFGCPSCPDAHPSDQEPLVYAGQLYFRLLI